MIAKRLVVLVLAICMSLSFASAESASETMQRVYFASIKALYNMAADNCGAPVINDDYVSISADDVNGTVYACELSDGAAITFMCKNGKDVDTCTVGAISADDFLPSCAAAVSYLVSGYSDNQWKEVLGTICDSYLTAKSGKDQSLDYHFIMNYAYTIQSEDGVLCFTIFKY